MPRTTSGAPATADAPFAAVDQLLSATTTHSNTAIMHYQPWQDLIHGLRPRNAAEASKLRSAKGQVVLLRTIVYHLIVRHCSSRHTACTTCTAAYPAWVALWLRYSWCKDVGLNKFLKDKAVRELAGMSASQRAKHQAYEWIRAELQYIRSYGVFGLDEAAFWRAFPFDASLTYAGQQRLRAEATHALAKHLDLDDLEFRAVCAALDIVVQPRIIRSRVSALDTTPPDAATPVAVATSDTAPDASAATPVVAAPRNVVAATLTDVFQRLQRPAVTPPPANPGPARRWVMRSLPFVSLLFILAASLMPPGVWGPFSNPVEHKGSVATTPLLPLATTIPPLAAGIPAAQPVVALQDDTHQQIIMLNLVTRQTRPLDMLTDDAEDADWGAPTNVAFSLANFWLAFTLQAHTGRTSLWLAALARGPDGWPQVEAPGPWEVLDDCDGCNDLDWSPTGDRLIYASRHGLRILDVGSGAVSVLTSDGGDSAPACAHDGRALAYQQADQNTVVVAAQDCSFSPDALTDAKYIEGYAASWGAAWSPDDTTLAFVSTAFDAQPTIYAVQRADLKARAALGLKISALRVSDEGRCFDPAWVQTTDPRGAIIVYTCVNGGNSQIIYAFAQHPNWHVVALTANGDVLYHPVCLALP